MENEINIKSIPVCKQCGSSLVGKRSNAKFCSNICRSAHKNESIKNQINGSSQVTKSVIAKTEDPNLGKSPLKHGAIIGEQKKELLPKENKLLNNLYRSLRSKQRILDQLIQNTTAEGIITATKAGSNWGKINTGTKLGGFLTGAVIFTGITALSLYTAGPIEKIKKEKIATLTGEIMWIKKEIDHIEKNAKNNYNPKTSSKLGLLLSAQNSSINTGNPFENYSEKSASNLGSPETNNKDSKSKAITIRELKSIDHQELNFNGKWQLFIGNPSVVFFMIIFGKPGKGKTTFAIRFAEYLSLHLGKVLFCSGEEGFEKTFQDKIKRLDVNAVDLYVIDSRTLEQIKAELETKHYNFVFVDSLDTLKIGSQEMKELRQLHPDIAFITISQSTKDGKMRGSNELIHDSDIVIQVDDGVATTTKNRFLETGKEFQVL